MVDGGVKPGKVKESYVRARGKDVWRMERGYR